MKRVLQICLIFILALSLIGFASAYSTNIHVKAPVNKQIQLSIISGNAVVQSWKNNSDAYGDFKVTFTSSLPSFDMIVFLKQGNDNLMSPERLTGVEAGKDVYVEMIPSGFEKVETPNETEEEVIEETSVNETEANSTGVVDENLEENETEDGVLDVTVTNIEDVNDSEGGSFLSGFSIFNNEGDAKYFYYFGIFFACLIFILLAGFITAKIVRKSSKKKDKEDDEEFEEDDKKSHGDGEIKVKKLSELQKEMEEKKNDESTENGGNEIAAKIDELQKKIDDLQKALSAKE